MSPGRWAFASGLFSLPDAFKPVAAPLYASVYRQLQIPNADAYFLRVVEIAGGAELAALPESLAGGGGQ